VQNRHHRPNGTAQSVNRCPIVSAVVFQIVGVTAALLSKSPNSVLVIDDEPQIRRFVSAGLELHGLSVREAGTGAAGLNTAAHMQPDVIVLDLGLPGADDYIVKPFGIAELAARCESKVLSR
jgi:DNA-binding response OmpR family regulator